MRTVTFEDTTYEVTVKPYDHGFGPRVTGVAHMGATLVDFLADRIIAVTSDLHYEWGALNGWRCRSRTAACLLVHQQILLLLHQWDMAWPQLDLISHYDSEQAPAKVAADFFDVLTEITTQTLNPSRVLDSVLILDECGRPTEIKHPPDGSVTRVYGSPDRRRLAYEIDGGAGGAGGAGRSVYVVDAQALDLTPSRVSYVEEAEGWKPMDF